LALLCLCPDSGVNQSALAHAHTNTCAHAKHTLTQQLTCTHTHTHTISLQVEKELRTAKAAMAALDATAKELRTQLQVRRLPAHAPLCVGLP